MYLIVVGAGQTRQTFVELAVADGHDVVAIEVDEEKAEKASAAYDCLVLHADATNESTIQEAGIDQADAVVSTTNVDSVNVMVMLLAREHEVANLLTVVHDHEHLPIFERIGVNVIKNPKRLIAESLYHSVKYPAVGDSVEIAEGTELIELTVTEGSPVNGMTLAKAKNEGILPTDSLVVAVKRGEELIKPDGATVPAQGGQVTPLVDEGRIDAAVSASAAD